MHSADAHQPLTKEGQATTTSLDHKGLFSSGRVSLSREAEKELLDTIRTLDPKFIFVMLSDKKLLAFPLEVSLFTCHVPKKQALNRAARKSAKESISRTYDAKQAKDPKRNRGVELKVASSCRLLFANPAFIQSRAFQREAA